MVPESDYEGESDDLESDELENSESRLGVEHGGSVEKEGHLTTRVNYLVKSSNRKRTDRYRQHGGSWGTFYRQLERAVSFSAW